MSATAFRQPKKITDLAEFAGEYIEFMRATPANAVCDALVDYAAGYVANVPVSDRLWDGLIVMFVDRIYLYAASLQVKDAAVRQYFGFVTRYVLDVAASRGARILYVLDNEIRADRFEIVMELMLAAGVFVVTPYTDGGPALEFADVRRAIEIELIAGRHIAYIEKDRSVNYLSQVMDVGRSTDRLVIYRNAGPESRELERIPSQRG